jgi:hypothetical protein
MWRPEDDALIQRLEDGIALEAIWRVHVGPRAGKPSARASGMIALVRDLTGGADAVNAALAGDARALRALLESSSLRDLPPALVHHIALYFSAVADALEAATPEAAGHVRVRALGAWLALAEERSYLAALARDVLGPEADPAELKRATDELALLPLDALGRRASDGARELSNPSRAAARALASTHAACRMAALSPPLAERAQRLAERHRTAAMDQALMSFQEALESASASNELAERGPAILGRIFLAWQWADHDEVIEQFAVEQAAPVLWELYRNERWNDMRALLEPLRPLVESLAARVERDPSRVAYAAAVATMFVFYVDVEPTLVGQIALAERAVRVCPSHRNGRFTLAGLLCEQAVRILDAGPFVSSAEVARARAMIDRAEQLNPSCKELGRARARIAAR